MILQVEGIKSLCYYDNINQIDISQKSYKTADEAINHFYSKDKTYQLIEDKETKGCRAYKAIAFWQNKDLKVIVTDCTFYVLNDKGKTINISGFMRK